MATNYDIDYNDKRFTEVEADKKAALNEVDVTYGNMISQSDKYYDKQIQASKDWADKQTQLQQEKTDFAIEQIEQQKDQTKKDYIKEQSGAYADWQKQSDPYGANAEKMASMGMTGTGYSESSQVSMYNTYQNRVATARESYTRAVLNYDNSMKEAMLQNNAALAEIAYQSLQQQLELSLQGFQYKNQLILAKADQKTAIDNTYYARYQDVLQQINQENALAEEVRQYNESLAEERRQYNASLAQQQAELAEEKRQFDASLAEEQRQFNESRTGGIINPGGIVNSGKTGTDISKAAQIIFENAVNSVGGVTGNTVNTAYYQGALNPDAKKYGTFSNGYQPKGISGHGTLKKSGETINLSTQVQYGADKGKKQTLEQNVWKAEDGTLWYWEGRQNKYIQIK